VIRFTDYKNEVAYTNKKPQKSDKIQLTGYIKCNISLFFFISHSSHERRIFTKKIDKQLLERRTDNNTHLMP